MENELPLTQQRPCTRMNTIATNQENIRMNNYIHADMGELPETARNVLIEIEGVDIWVNYFLVIMSIIFIVKY